MPRIIGASTYSENFQGGDITDDEWTFMKAMEAYQRRWRRRYPSWREVLYVIECLGYRKVAKARPADASPPTQAELAFAATARKALESVSPQLPV